MNHTAARALATALMAQHGLTGWRLVFDNARTRAGVCHSDRKVIGLSRHLMALYSPEHVTETVLHEIAHALAGPRHGHDRTWRTIARRIGCTGRRCMPADAPKVEGAWEGICAAGHRTTTHRRPVRVRSCTDCNPAFDASALYSWTLHGLPAPMHPSYEAELARIRAPRTEPIPVRLAVGDRVRLTGGGRYGGLAGTIVKRGRTRYQVRTSAGMLSAAFTLVQPLTRERAEPGRTG